MALFAPPAAQGLRKVVTVVFCDLVGSTRLGEELDPETLRQVLARYFEVMSEVLMRHEGAIQQFIGDAVLAVFGMPTLHEDDAVRAVRAADEMRAALRELNGQLELRWGVRLQARTGVDTGEVIVGEALKGEASVSGDAVTVAARLEQSAPPGEVLIGEQTVELVRGSVLVQAVAPLEIKGKSQPLRAFRLLDVAAPDRGIDRGLGGRPLVAREPEIDALRGAFDRTVSAGGCQLVTVAGPAGIGKTRLTREFVRSLGVAARTVTGRCLSYGQGLTFWPLREIVAELAGTEDGDSAEEVVARVARLLPADDDRAVVAERVAGALGVLDSTAYPAETFWAIRKLLEAVARERPLVVVLEDIQWAEPTFLDLIEYLPTATAEAVLVVAVTRTELFDTKPDFAATIPGAARIELQPLSEPDSRQLVEHLAGDAGMTRELSERLVASAEGNPLFVEELVRMLIDERRLEKDASALSMPATIQAVLAARLDRLDSDERAIVSAAAIIGRSFSDEATLSLAGARERSELEQQLGALVRKQVIEPDGGRFAGRRTFSFKHILLHDVAYQAILKTQRADLHVRYADWLERETGERATEYEEILGHHLEHSHRNLSELGSLDERGHELGTRAARHLGSSGARALARGDIRPAVVLLERAVSLLPEDDPARRDLTLKLGIGLAESGQLSRADALLADRIRAERRGRAFVAFHDGSGRQQVVTLEDERSPMTIGRRPDNDIVLSWDSEVSRRQAHLLHTGKGWALVDDQSRNGSFLNGERVTRQRSLSDGDVFRFGDTVVLFRAPVPDEHRQRSVFLEPEQVTYMGQGSTRSPTPAPDGPDASS